MADLDRQARSAATPSCPACGNTPGIPDPSRFACPDCWDALGAPVSPEEAALLRQRAQESRQPFTVGSMLYRGPYAP